MSQQYGRKTMQFPFKSVDLIAACAAKANHHLSRYQTYQGIANATMAEIQEKGVSFKVAPRNPNQTYTRGGVQIDSELQDKAESAQYKAQGHLNLFRDYKSYAVGLEEMVTAYTDQFNQSEDMRERAHRENQELASSFNAPGITQFPGNDHPFVRQTVDVNVLRTAVTAEDLIWLGLVLAPGEEDTVDDIF